MLSLNMFNALMPKIKPSHGFTLIEVLVTFVIMAVGLLGFLNLQNRSLTAELEASNRVQASILAEYMIERIKSDPDIATHCTGFTPTTFGVDYNSVFSCSSFTQSAAAANTWDALLDGEHEKMGTADMGAPAQARGCVDYQIRTNLAPAKYTVSVAWRGFSESKVSDAGVACGKDEYNVGSVNLRRVISYDVIIPSIDPYVSPPNCADDNTCPPICELDDSCEDVEPCSSTSWTPAGGWITASSGSSSYGYTGHSMYLTQNTTFSGNLEMTDLCLNGHTLTINNGSIKIEEFNCHQVPSPQLNTGNIILNNEDGCYIHDYLVHYHSIPSGVSIQHPSSDD